MNTRYVSEGIILSRTNYAEADRIMTFITPEHGKVTAIAKGVRKQKSKLAGGIELFSVAKLTFLIGRSKINTLISTRLIENFSNISKQMERSEAGYEMLRLTNKATEENAETAYYQLLKTSLSSLNDIAQEPSLVLMWFQLRLLNIAGHQPNMNEDGRGNKLAAANHYNFDIELMHFLPAGEQGRFSANHIKFLRLAQASQKPELLKNVQCGDALKREVELLVKEIIKIQIRG